MGFSYRRFPFYFKKDTFSIGLYLGDSPFSLSEKNSINNPIVSNNDIDSFPCRFVADPFLINQNNIWYIFYEAMNDKSNLGNICFSYSDNLKDWNYGGIAISEEFHLSYPYLFKSNGKLYMVPETARNFEVRLYECIDFPHKWIYIKTLLEGRYTDPSIINENGIWFIYLTETGSNILRLFSASNITDQWIEHPNSPIIINDKTSARSAGKIIKYHDKLYRFSQDCSRIYGERVNAYQIIEINQKRYIEKEYNANPILKPSGVGWNSHRMHHIHAIELNDNQWIAAVDGLKSQIGLFFK